MTQMEELHDQVLETLLTWQRDRNAAVHLGSGGDAYSLFYLRRTQDAAFKRGYWFPGNDSYLLISFWSGSDTRNRTPNAYLRMHKTQGCSAYFTARDSSEKRVFFEQLRTQTLQKYLAQKTSGLWRTAKLGALSEWRDVLERYYNTDKKILDKAIAQTEGGVGSEFETKFGFLDQGGFDRSLSNVLAQQAEILREQRKNKIDTIIKSFDNEDIGQPPVDAISIGSFSITNFQGIKYADVKDLNLASRWIFLTGENGFGKTSVLQAIAHTLSGPREDIITTSSQRLSHDRSIISGEIIIPAQLRVDYWRKGQAVSVGKTVGVYEGQIEGYLGPFIVAYGPIRLEPMKADMQNSVNKQDNVTSLLDEEITPLYNVDYELNQAFFTVNETRFNTLKEIIQSITNGRISDVKVDKSTGQVSYTEMAQGVEPVAIGTPYKELATGYKALINLSIDIYMRLSMAQPKVKSIHDLIGLVLIDELENHLHPHLQRQLPISLRTLFPKVQFIVSTHSPIPLLGAPSDALFLRVDRSKKDGITVVQVKMDINVSTLLPTAILSSPLFGFEDFLSENLASAADLNTADTYDEALLLADLKAKYQQHQQQAIR